MRNWWLMATLLVAGVLQALAETPAQISVAGFAAGRTNSVAMVFALSGSVDQVRALDEKFAAYKPLFERIIQGTSIGE